MFVKVKNISGTTKRASLPNGYSSWKDFWEQKKKTTFNGCANLSCTESAKVGAHVRIVDEGQKWYIVPFCIGCNNSSDEITVKQSMLCPVNDD